VNIAGQLIWYDEPPGMLAASVAGFARVCDMIVAVDGAYALYPDARTRSRPDQAEAIIAACEAHDCGLVLHRPKDLFWGNEVAKRNLALDLLRPFLESEVDWVLAFDADYLMLQVQPEQVRHELANCEENVATYTLLDGKDLTTDEFMQQYAAKRHIDHEWTFRTRGAYRWTPDLTYGPAHWTISGTYQGRHQWIYGPDLLPGDERFAPIEPAHNLNDLLVAHHRREYRSLTRKQSAEGYYLARDAAGAESLALVNQ
jgi:hypothetical protein